MRLVLLLLPWLIASAFSAPTPAPTPTIESVMKSDWKWLEFTAVAVLGCVGAQPPESIFLARSGETFTVYKVSRDDYWKETFSKGRTVRASEAYQIISRFLGFYIQAINEMSISEHFNAMPAGIREQELEKYFQTHGRPIGGWDDFQIFLTYEPGNLFEHSLRQTFGDSDNWSLLASWIHDEKGE
jgi:hypothetical protein